MLQISPVCGTFQDLSQRTFEIMRRNHNSKIWVREDGITAINLQELHFKHSPRITVIPFSGYEESNVTGADWEWWFAEVNRAIGFAVQAKSQSRAGTFSVNSVPRGKTKPQIDQLIEYATQNAVYPLYCFYGNIAARGVRINNWPCQSFTPQADLFGCSVADAHAVNLLNKANRRHANDLLDIAFPWHCLVCCPGGGQTAGAAMRAGFALNMLRRSAGSGPMNDLFTAELPDRIQQVMEMSSSRNSQIDVGEVSEIPMDVAADLWEGSPPKYVVVVQSTDE